MQEATRLSLVSGDQASYARSIRIMGDIYRKKTDINVSKNVKKGTIGRKQADLDQRVQFSFV